MPLRFVRQAVANNTAQSLVLHTRVPARQKQANLCLSYKMKEQFFGAWDKGTPRPKCKRLYLVAIVAIGLVCDVSSALKGSPPLRLEVPSFKLHSPFTSTVRMCIYP